MPGFLLIDKPPNITSHDVVERVRRLTGEKRVGHAGTLDPFATGLLIVGVGREATREFHKLVGLDKKYEATFILGATSDTDDQTGKISVANPLILPLRKGETVPAFFPPFQGGIKGGGVIHNALQKFIGEISQIPPTYSAIKIGGKKMYEAAREGKPLEAAPRHVTIYNIELLETPLLNNSTTQRIFLTIHCSTGTYIRAIARDLGKALETGGYVEKLRRTEIGSFSITESVALTNLTPENLQTHLITISNLLSRLA